MAERTIICSPNQANQPALAVANDVMQGQDNLNKYLQNDQESYLPVQRKLSIGSVDDPLEDEADATADKVMRMPETNFIQRKCSHCEEEEEKVQRKPEMNFIQRKCAHCEEEETVNRKPLASFIQRKESAGTVAATDTLSNHINSTKGNGNLMDADTKDFMESRFRADFSGIKIHTGHEAAQMSRDIQAKAFTTGNDIYFNEGQYQPRSSEGKHLLAHELMHTLQQNGNHTLQRQTEGTANIEDTIHDLKQDPKTHLWQGLADRQEYVPAAGKTPRRNLTLLNNIRVEFDPGTCTINLPTRIKFVHPKDVAGLWPFCGEDKGTLPPASLDEAKFNSIKSNFLALANSWLNGWFSVQITNCENSCAGKNININAIITEDSANPTTTVIIADKKGRSCANASTIVIHAQGVFGGGAEDSRLTHEAGHTVLGYPDEYPVDRGNKNPESVHRKDYSMAGSSTEFGNWMQLQERHFAFVPTFLKQIFPGCNAELIRNPRSDVTFLLPVEAGWTSYGGGGIYGSTGFDLGLPLDVHRHLQLMLGTRLHGIQSLDYPATNALLAGFRLGLFYSTNPSAGGFRIGGFGEIGGGTFSGADKLTTDKYDTGRFTSPYYQVGGSAGYEFGPGSGPGSSVLSIGLSASYGSTIDVSAIDTTRYGSKDWYFVGLTFGWQWHK